MWELIGFHPIVAPGLGMRGPLPDTRRLDRMVRMPIYAQYEVPYLRLIDPMDKTLEVYRLKEGEWWWLRRPMRYELRL